MKFPFELLLLPFTLGALLLEYCGTMSLYILVYNFFLICFPLVFLCAALFFDFLQHENVLYVREFKAGILSAVLWVTGPTTLFPAELVVGVLKLIFTCLLCSLNLENFVHYRTLISVRDIV